MVNCEEAAQGLHYLFCEQWHRARAAVGTALHGALGGGRQQVVPGQALTNTSEDAEDPKPSCHPYGAEQSSTSRQSSVQSPHFPRPADLMPVETPLPPPRLQNHSGWRRPLSSPGPTPTHPTVPTAHIPTALEHLRGNFPLHPTCQPPLPSRTVGVMGLWGLCSSMASPKLLQLSSVVLINLILRAQV